MSQPEQATARVALSAAKSYHAGTHRTVAPAATVARLRPLLPALGITRVANVTGLDHIGIPVVMVCRPNARALSVAQGKGLDLAAAQASGLMEAVESYHAERITLPLKLAAYEELRYTHPVVEVAALPRLSVGLFHPEQPIHWIEGYDLLGRAPAWLPFDLVHTNYTLAMQRTMAGFAATSNGLASGNHPLEAISHAICELIERDAATLWHLLGPQAQARTRVDLESVDDPGCRVALEAFACAGMLVAVWECTSDVGVPAFICGIIERAPGGVRRLGYTEGMGCHPAREIALLRALTEAAQARLTLIAGSRDDCTPAQYVAQRDPQHEAALRQRLAAGLPGRPFVLAPTLRAASLDEDVAWLLQRLRAAGFAQVIVVDLTRPELGIPVVRVVVPGLEPPAEGNAYRPGRRAKARMEGRL